MADQRREQTPPGGGKADHEAMQAAAMRPMKGPDDVPQAAGGGLELPGREAHEEALGHRGPEQSAPAGEPIPGERDRGTLMWREPGSMGGRPSGADTPSSDRGPALDAKAAADRAAEGGGAD